MNKSILVLVAITFVSCSKQEGGHTAVPTNANKVRRTHLPKQPAANDVALQQASSAIQSEALEDAADEGTEEFVEASSSPTRTFSYEEWQKKQQEEEESRTTRLRREVKRCFRQRTKRGYRRPRFICERIVRRIAGGDAGASLYFSEHIAWGRARVKRTRQRFVWLLTADEEYGLHIKFKPPLRLNDRERLAMWRSLEAHQSLDHLDSQNNGEIDSHILYVATRDMGAFERIDEPMSETVERFGGGSGLLRKAEREMRMSGIFYRWVTFEQID